MSDLTLHAWPTPNAYKISLMLEECGLSYDVAPVDIGKGDQFTPDFLKLNPNSKMPVLVDAKGPDGKPVTIFESGAILIYLAEKTGKFLPEDTQGRYATLQWLMWQMGGFGPMLGQANHFVKYAPEKIQYGIDRYSNEAKRLYKVLDTRLGESKFVAVNDYTIADMAIYPWAKAYAILGIDNTAYKNVQRWLAEIEKRPATAKGMALMEEYKRKPDQKFTDEERKVLFGTR